MFRSKTDSNDVCKQRVRSPCVDSSRVNSHYLGAFGVGCVFPTDALTSFGCPTSYVQDMMYESVRGLIRLMDRSGALLRRILLEDSIIRNGSRGAREAKNGWFDWFGLVWFDANQIKSV